MKLRENIKIYKIKIKKLCLIPEITQIKTILTLEVFKIDRNRKLFKILIEICSRLWRTYKTNTLRLLRKMLS